MLAKWLQLEPKLLLLDEPTQGVDVAAREQIFSIIGAVAANGAAVICASSDHDQLARLCDRVLIVARGRISAELAGGNVSKAAREGGLDRVYLHRLIKKYGIANVEE